MSTSFILRSCLILTCSAMITTGPVMAEDCLDCHKEIAGDFASRSHHIQGVAVSGSHCYACHWEAQADGSLNAGYHRRDGQVDLVIWGNMSRPTKYKLNDSAVIYSFKSVGSKDERAAFSGITLHCLSCHNDQNSTTATFSGDRNTPGSYAWDRESIASRYSDKGITTWGKYSTATSNKKHQVIKALSAHGNAAANEGGWSTAGGYDEAIPNTRKLDAAVKVECYDCHNPHGSAVTGVTTSYSSAAGDSGGGLLKQTVAGRSGYKNSYTPSANGDLKSINPYNRGAGLCFDCHESPDTTATPWGYQTTFGASEPVLGYKDTHRFGLGVKGSTSRHAERAGRSEIISSHLKSGVLLNHSAATAINGLCTPCHDPHGISRTLGDRRGYATPLLKGTWLTSPYREDARPSGPVKARQPGSTGYGLSGTAGSPVSMQGMQYNIDRNTFGPNGKIAENPEDFAGLCLKCHTKLRPVGKSKIDGIHRSVKGWGGNKEHAFPCSKCHQAHNSGLPKLMQTNCFEEGPAGLRDNIGLSWLPDNKGKATESQGRASAAQSTGKSSSSNMVGCHVRQFGKSSGPKGSSWQKKGDW